MKFEYDSNKSGVNKEKHGIDFEEAFDNGEDISQFVYWSKARRPNLEQKWVNLDLPVWMIERLDFEAKRLGVARQAIMKMFLAQHFDMLKNPIGGILQQFDNRPHFFGLSVIVVARVFEVKGKKVLFVDGDAH